MGNDTLTLAAAPGFSEERQPGPNRIITYPAPKPEGFPEEEIGQL